MGDVLIAAYLYSWGEPFLNQDIFRMIGDCTARNIRTLIPTNGQCLQTREEALAVVDSGLSAIIFAIDGSTQEIYESYRKGGDVEKAKRCAAQIEEAKALRNSPYPYTCMRTVVTRDNQDDLPNLERLARDLGVNMFATKTVGCKTWDESFRDFEPTEEGLRRFEYEGAERHDGAPIECIFPFRQPTIKWDGTVIGCEFDTDLESPWGRVGDQSFAEIWNGPQARELRRGIHRGNRGSFCEKHCPYQDRIQDGSAIRNLELRPLKEKE
jgi:MoaA/NifB/PqqE/SkfB family radical SAM enzyme